MPKSPVSTVPWESHPLGARLPAGRWLRRAALPVVCMAIVACAVGGVASWWIADQNQRTMTMDAHRLVDQIQKRFNDYAQIDVGVRSFWAVHQPLQHDDLSMYVAGLDLVNRFPGLQTVTISELVPPGALEQSQFDQRQRDIWSTYTHGQWLFQRHGSTVLSPHSGRIFLGNGPPVGQEVVTYVEPWQNFSGSIGRILTEDPAMEASLKLGRDQDIATTGNVIMGKGLHGETFPAVGIRLPLFNGPSSTVEDRRAHYVGSVGLGLRLDTFLSHLLVDNDLEYMDVQVFTIPTKGGNSITLKPWSVFDSRRLPSNSPFTLAKGSWGKDLTIDIGGYRLWAKFTNNRLPVNAPSPLWALIAGLMTFGSMFTLWLLVDSTTETRRRAVRMTDLATHDLKKQQALLNQASEMAGVGHWHLDMATHRLVLSPKAEEILGIDSLHLDRDTWLARISPEDVEPWKQWHQKLFESSGQNDHHLEYRYRRNEEILWIHVVGRRVESDANNVVLQGSIIDITQRKQDDFELRLKHLLGTVVTSLTDQSEEEDGHRALFDQQRLFDNFIQRLCEETSQPGGVVWLKTSTDGPFERVGSYGMDPFNGPSNPVTMEWPERPWSGVDVPDRTHVVKEHRSDQALAVRLSWPLRSNQQTVGWIELYGAIVRDALVHDLNTPAIQRTIFQEALQLLRYHTHYKRLNHLAGTDSLTGLMSRYRFTETLRERLSNTDVGHGVLFVDLDGFKKVNDSMGHATGDMVLQEIAQRFKACLGPLDTIGRVGGDEFAIVTSLAWSNGPGSSVQREPLLELAERLITVSERPFRLNNQSSFLSASIGIAVAPDDGLVASELIKRADIAMYAVKKSNKNGFQMYTTELEQTLLVRHEIEMALKEAPFNQEMTMVYQPKFKLDVDQRPVAVGVESLLRWDSAVMGSLSPDTFIPIAEDSGDIHVLSQWVMRTVAEQLVRWDNENQGLPPVHAAVNLSPKQFMDQESLHACLAWLDRLNVDPGRITLEITEGCLMESPEQSQVLLQRLHERGFRIAIDDFGMGYSSLAYLKTFHVDELKIDKSFVQNMGKSPEDAAIVDAILNMARSLGMEVVAEGVETLEQLNQLRAMGCSIFQGFLFSKPLVAGDLNNFRQSLFPPLPQP